jgi:hypothetical protein
LRNDVEKEKRKGGTEEGMRDDLGKKQKSGKLCIVTLGRKKEGEKLDDCAMKNIN